MNRLRTYTQNFIDTRGITWYRLALNAGIDPRIIYRFKKGYDISGENTVRLMEYMQIINKEKYHGYDANHGVSSQVG